MFTAVPSQASQYDLEKFKQFLAGHSLPQLKDVSGILVLGEMGAGKSTAIAIQLGAVYKLNKTNKKWFYELISSGTYTPNTSHDRTSTTLNIGAYPDPRNHRLYIDTAGLNENRGKEEKLWTKNSLSLLFSTVKEFKSVVVVIDYAKVFSGRDAEILALADGLSRITMGDNRFYESMVFVITNGHTVSGRIDRESVLMEVSGVLAQFKEREEKLIARLNKNYPITSKTLVGKAVRGVAMVAAAINPLDEQSHSIFDPEKVPEDDMRDLRLLQDCQRFLEAMQVNNGQRIVLSYPDDKDACQRIRTELLDNIALTQPIQRYTLQTIKEKSIADTSLLFFNVLSSLTAHYVPDLSKQATLLTTLIEYYERETETLEAIERDWKSVRDQLVAKKNSEKTEYRAIIGTQKAEIRQLESSIDSKVIEERHILKEREAGFISIKYLWGNAQAKETYTYAAKQAFVSYKHDDGEHFSVDRKEHDPFNGELKIDFTSHNGHDLNLKVKVFVREKDLPATKDRVAILKNDNLEKERQLRILETAVLVLNSVQNKKQLYDEVTKENKALKDELQMVIALFDKRLNKEKTEWDAVKGLESLLTLLKNLKGFHADLSAPNLQTIDDFLRNCETIKMAGQNKYLGRILPNIAEPAQFKREENKGESSAPVVEKTFLNKITNSLDAPIKAINIHGSNFFQIHQFEFGCCGALLGALLWFESSPSSTKIFSALLITLGVFTTLSYIRTSIEKIATDVGRITNENRREFQVALEQVKSEIEVEAKKINITARELGVFAVKELSEKINLNVDLKADIRTPKSFVSGVNVF